MNVFCECRYCGHKWDSVSYGYEPTLKRGDVTPKGGGPGSRRKCPTCGDKNVKIHKQPERGNFFGYEEEPEEKTPLLTDWTD